MTAARALKGPFWATPWLLQLPSGPTWQPLGLAAKVAQAHSCIAHYSPSAHDSQNQHSFTEANRASSQTESALAHAAEQAAAWAACGRRIPAASIRRRARAYALRVVAPCAALRVALSASWCRRLLRSPCRGARGGPRAVRWRSRRRWPPACAALALAARLCGGRPGPPR